MRARLAFTMATVALLTSPAAPAGTDSFQHRPPRPQLDNAAEEIHTPEPAAGAIRAAHRVDRIPYRFECDVTRRVDDRITTTTRRREGELGDEPVHFEANSFLIREPDRSIGGEYACAIEIGKGRDEDVLWAGATAAPVVAKFAVLGHGHNSYTDDDGNWIGLGWIRLGSGVLLRGHRIRLEWHSRQEDPRGASQHSAACDGLTLQRVTDLRPVESWCSHEDPPIRRDKTDAPPADPSHDEEPSSVVPEDVAPLVPDVIEDALPVVPPPDAVLPPIDLSFEPERRFELLTCRLRGGCSAPELLRQAAVGPV